jgi:hypothetical protein
LSAVKRRCAVRVAMLLLLLLRFLDI